MSTRRTFAVHLQLAVMTDIAIRATDPEAANAIAVALCADQLQSMHRAGFHIRHHNVHTTKTKEIRHD